MKKIIEVRYYLCYIHYQRNEWAEAIKIGEKIARQYPTTAQAQPCAKIAVSAYLKQIKEDTDPESRRSLLAKFAELLDYSITTWAGRPFAMEMTKIKLSLDALPGLNPQTDH